MFKQLLLLVVLISLPPLSFAQLAEHTFETSIEEGQIYIIIQVEIRDPNENLVGYIETDRVTVNDLDQLLIILDEMSSNPENSKILTIDDTKYRVITGVGNAKYISDTYVSMSVITNDDQPIVYANYDGFPIRTGDKIITTWTMVQRI